MSFLGEPKVARENTFIIRDDSVSQKVLPIFTDFKKRTKGLSTKKYMKELREFQELLDDLIHRDTGYLDERDNLQRAMLTYRIVGSELAVFEMKKKKQITNKC